MAMAGILELAEAGGQKPAELTLINTVPSAFAQVGEAGLPASVKQVHLAGEPLLSSLVEEALQQRPDLGIWNLYAPTETTTYSTCACIGREKKTPAIGRPIRNTKVYVVDEEREAVGVGARGELYIGGAGVTRGYWKRGGLTAEKFVPDWLSGEQGGRLYRTGDEVRWRGNGELEYLGRKDGQVKVRGYRIELGEIESQLQRQEGVRQAAVVVTEDGGNGKRLVAYVVRKEVEAEPARAVTSAELRQSLAGQLPGYMVPGQIVFVEELPMLPNGKLDRKRLPKPGMEQESSGYLAPNNEVERVLCGIWAEVLRREHVGIRENFFELGGDSILSIQIVARAQEKGMRITARQMFQEPTVEGLARLVAEQSQWEGEEGSEEGKRLSGVVEMTPIQRWYLEQEREQRGHFNQSVLLEAEGGLSGEDLRAAVEQVMEQHDSLRLRYRRTASGEWEQSYGEGEQVYGRVDLREVREEEQSGVVEGIGEQAQRSLRLEEGPVVRVVGMEMEGSGRVLLVAHHLVIDAVSWRILLEDLERGYEGRRKGEKVSLGRKSSGYQKWSEALVGSVRRGEWEEDRKYWAGELKRGGGGERLPRDWETGSNGVGEEEVLVVELDEEQTRGVLQELPRQYRTQVQEVLLGAVMEAVSQWSGQSQVWVDVEGHGREEMKGIDLTRTVGWFTTLTPVRLENVGGTVVERLQGVKEKLRGMKRGGLGYGVLRYLSASPEEREALMGARREIVFNYLGQFDQVLNREGGWRLAGESAGREQDEKETRPYLLEISGGVMARRLRMSWRYSRQIHRPGTIEALARHFRDTLLAYLDPATQSGEVLLSAADFPDWPDLTGRELETIMQSRGQAVTASQS